MPRTWGGRSEFEYTGSIETGTNIVYGESRRIHVSAAQYAELRAHFLNRTVPAGTSRTTASPESLGAWLQSVGIQTAVASYVAPILVEERYAERVGRNEIQVLR